MCDTHINYNDIWLIWFYRLLHMIFVQRDSLASLHQECKWFAYRRSTDERERENSYSPKFRVFSRNFIEMKEGHGRPALGSESLTNIQAEEQANNAFKCRF